jgi:uncharacterized protein (DUF2267 family)
MDTAICSERESTHRSQQMATGLGVFDRSIHTTTIWLKEISSNLRIDRHSAGHVLGVVVRALRDRLPVEDAAHRAAQIPLVVRGRLYEQYRPAVQPYVMGAGPV